MALHCDDCGHQCREGCAFVSPNEQPYFQAFRVAKRIPIGEPWDAWDYLTWNSAQWRSFCEARGVSEAQKLLHADDFRGWLFRSVGHPASPTTQDEGA